MPEHFVTLGASWFHATEIEIGALPRTITVCSNALSAEPVQVNSFVSGYMPVRIDGFMVGLETQDETATAHLIRLKKNLQTEVGKDSNTLLINWTGTLGGLETYRVFKNENYALVYTWTVQESHRIDFSLTLNCLP